MLRSSNNRGTTTLKRKRGGEGRERRNKDRKRDEEDEANEEKQTDLSESTGLTTCLPASRYATGWGSLGTVSNLR